MGDPETEVVIPRITSDLLNLLKGINDGTFSEKDLEISKEFATTIMLVSKGYPRDYQKGKEISGIESVKESLVFHAGQLMKDVLKQVRKSPRTNFFLEKEMNSALEKSLESAEKISFEGKYYRKD